MGAIDENKFRRYQMHRRAADIDPAILMSGIGRLLVQRKKYAELLSTYDPNSPNYETASGLIDHLNKEICAILALPYN